MSYPERTMYDRAVPFYLRLSPPEPTRSATTTVAVADCCWYDSHRRLGSLPNGVVLNACRPSFSGRDRARRRPLDATRSARTEVRTVRAACRRADTDIRKRRRVR